MKEKTIPSVRMAREIEEMVMGGIRSVGEFLLKNSALMIQRTLELESEEFTGRKWYGRGEEAPVHRNGYEPKRVGTAEGMLEVFMPQFRNAEEPFQSKLSPALGKRSDNLELLSLQMWVSGMSRADIARVFRRELGVKGMSESVIGNLCQELQGRQEAFCRQDLSSHEVLYVFLDGIYLRMGGGRQMKDAVLVAVGITRAGRKVLLGLSMGPRESHESWKSFLSDMKGRGLNDPLLVIRDGNPGLIRALGEVFSYSAQQVCLAHKMRNLVAKMPEGLMDALRANVHEVFYAKDYVTAVKLARQLIKEYRGKAEGFIKCFEKDLDSSLGYLLFPQNHWRSIRTTNLIERRFEEVRRRTKVIPRFQTERSALLLCHAVLIEDMKTNRWHGIRTTEEDQKRLETLKRKLLVEKQDLKMVA